MRPDVLLLDEPFSQLDAPGEQRLRRLIRELKAQGRVVIVSAHEVDPDDPLWDVRVDLAEARACRLNPCLPQPAAAPRASGAGAPVLQAQGLEFRTPSGTAVLAGLDLHLFPGTTTQVAGTNASGKSTLLRCLAGLLTPCAGQVVIDGVTAPRPGRLAGRLGYLPQNADMGLFELLDETANRGNTVEVIWVYQEDDDNMVGAGLTDPRACALVNVWMNIGASFIFLLVGFRSVPLEMIESATIDGAGPFGKTIHGASQGPGRAAIHFARSRQSGFRDAFRASCQDLGSHHVLSFLQVDEAWQA